MSNVFETLSKIDVNEHVEQKGNLSYLSWAWAWHYVKSHYPTANFTIYETPEGRPYFDDGRTAWVKTGVTIEGLEHIEYLPIMDNYNRSIPVDKITSFNVNTSIQRSLTKAAARHGLGLYIYAGEDLPMVEDAAPQPQQPAPFKPLDDNSFWAVVAAAAKGIKTKSGGNYRDEYRKQTNAGPVQMKDFDDAVTDYKVAHQIQ